MMAMRDPVHQPCRHDDFGLFWTVFVLTRPLGATAGDYLSELESEGGLGYGTVGSSIVLASVLSG
ncbi:hypothetical protein G3I60_08645 [Streptomyces sp. SID13666]|uniref:hypothetical protein n=1 Tax=unclassified Streptomyces TaxID=2593676 RepID=UPI0013BF5F9E|nr:hypothetical protein [Streptomyces sp. SID13666]NEA70316.1 hypothetical protein [Streptomyces sp. SID13588]